MKIYLLILSILLASSCGKQVNSVKNQHQQSKTPSNRIDIPSHVQKNLGITFATAQYRRIEQQLNVPGVFELHADAKQHFTTPSNGRIQIHVKTLQQVKVGDLLYTLESPNWIDLQDQLSTNQSKIIQAQGNIKKTQAQVNAAVKLNSGIGLAKQQLQVAQAQHSALHKTQNALLRKAALLHQIPVTALQTQTEGKSNWEHLQAINIRSHVSGTVADIRQASGSWLSADSDVLQVINNQELHFHASALQADAHLLKNGQTVHIKAPTKQDTLTGRLIIGTDGDAQTRTINILVALPDTKLPQWVHPSLSCIASIVIAGTNNKEVLSIPRQALIQDGTELIFFRRDPKHKDKVIRSIADIGAMNDDWVEIRSALAEGNEVVLQGNYALKLASSGQSKAKGGHFHADGTWHAEDH